jgi:hypothetical protein
MKERRPSVQAHGDVPRASLGLLESARVSAPPHLVPTVMAAIEKERGAPGVRSWAVWLLRFREGGGVTWAAAALALIMAGWMGLRASSPARVEVVFQFHAPDARSVELVGNFTGWETGVIRLEGPDATGHWTARVKLPSGRHEYAFLVDGKEWIADPRAVITRPDGFGRRNAVMEL